MVSTQFEVVRSHIVGARVEIIVKEVEDGLLDIVLSSLLIVYVLEHSGDVKLFLWSIHSFVSSQYQPGSKGIWVAS